MIKPIHIPVLVVLASIALFSGCGDSDSAATPLTKAQFVKQGDAICAKADRAQIDAFLASAKKNPKKAETQSGEEELITTAGLPPVKTAIEELGELGVPEGDEQQIEAILSGMEKALREAEADPGTVVLETSQSTPFDGVEKLAREYGFVACADVL